MRSAVTVDQLLRVRARLHPRRELVRCEGRAVTYEEVNCLADVVAGRLLDSGAQSGDRIAVMADQTIEAWLLLFGAARCGVVPVLVNWRLSPREIGQIVLDAGATTLLHTDRLAQLAANVPTNVPRRSVEALASAFDGDTNATEGTYEASNATPSAEDVVVQLYTSGTTGFPKGVLTTHSNVLGLIDAISAELPGFGSDSLLLVAAPLFHIAGYGFALSALEVGAGMVLLPVFDPAGVVHLVETERPTHSLLVPAMLLAVSLLTDVDSRDFSSIRGILYGGSPISIQLLSRISTLFGCRLTQAYGLTETTGLATMLRWDDHEKGLLSDDEDPARVRLASGGFPVPGTTVSVRGPDGSEVETLIPGEVWIQSGLVAAGYWRRDDDRTFDDFWFRSGDIGYLDEGGYLFLIDRVNDLVVTGGENVFPGEVERVLGEHPAVLEVAVVGVPDETFGETICAVIVSATPEALTVESVREFCRVELAGFKLPRRVEFVDELPKTPSGKVQRRLVREAYWSGHERQIN